MMRRNSITWLIVKGLGYCCEWKFFSLYRDSAMIAARLGVTERAIRKHKAAYNDYETDCENCDNCMKSAKSHSKA